MAQPTTLFAPVERVDAEQLAAQSRHFSDAWFFGELLHYVPDMVMILNQQRQLVYANRAVLQFAKAPDLSTVIGQRPGELFGWSSLFPAERKKARARVVKPMRAIAIDADLLRAAWQTDHTLEHAIIQRTATIMVSRLRTTRQRLADALTKG